MNNLFNKIFSKNKNVIIGAIHFPPLSGYKDFPGREVALKNALMDLSALEKGGVDGIIIENNYDIPHKTFVTKEVADDLEFLSREIKKSTKLPIGISVLWNDYITALNISKKVELDFIRVPVFVDDVETTYGSMGGKANDVIEFRKEIGAENVALFTDIHVKHAKILSPHTLVESARLATQKGSDALVVTGKWTGDAPNINDLKIVRNAVGEFPVLCGSGVDAENIRTLFTYANGAIVSTSLKEGGTKEGEINIKPYNSRINTNKVKVICKEVIK